MSIKKLRADRPKLTFVQANLICSQLLSIGDEAPGIMEQLRLSGFKAFDPYNRFVESFCDSQEELLIHHRYIVEWAKERLGQPTPISIPDMDLVYFSPFLKSLRSEREKNNGVPVDQLSSHFSGGECAWRYQIDPCERRKVYSEVNHKDLYEMQRNIMLQQQRQQLEIEVRHHSTALSERYAFDKEGRYSLFNAVMYQSTHSTGLQFDKSRSRSAYPVFTKPINDNWDLCLVIEEPRFFNWSASEGDFSPFLEVRSKKLRGKLNKAEPGEFLNLRYCEIVPGFFSAYRKFCSLAELETIIKAHLCLYETITPALEKGLQQGFNYLTQPDEDE